jgi:hypothetical protein
MHEKKNTYKFYRKPEGKKPFSIHKFREENNIKMDLNRIGNYELYSSGSG